jgi:folate-binding protein YgfZ
MMPKQSLLAQLLLALGPRFGEHQGRMIAMNFGDGAAEYRAARARAALFDCSDSGKIEVAGRDSAAFLHNLCTNDVKRLDVGRGCEAFLTTSQGKTMALACIFRMEPDRFCLDSGRVQGDVIARHLAHFLVSEDVAIAERSDELAQLHLVGPEAHGILGSIAEVGSDVPELSVHQAQWRGTRFEIRVRSRLGTTGFDLIAEPAAAAALWEVIIDSGAVPAGFEAYEAMRIDAGIPEYGVDIDETNLPQETGLTERAVSFEKGCYIGQETIARIRAYGHVNRYLVRLSLGGLKAPKPGCKLFSGQTEIGRVTSASRAPSSESVVALGYVRRGFEQPGQSITMQDGDETYAAVVSPLRSVAGT